jgi:uncharacterized membrane protein (UPF0127 family)
MYKRLFLYTLIVITLSILILNNLLPNVISISYADQENYKKLELQKLDKAILTFGKNNSIPVYILKTTKDKNIGFSGRKPEDFKENEGLLFYYKKTKPRSFWMPNTFFNLDIIFLDKNFKIIEIVRNLNHFPRWPINNKEHLVPKTKWITSRYILEIKSKTKLSKIVNKNTSFKLNLIKK